MVGGVLHAHQTGLAHEVGALAVGLDDQIAAVGVLRVVDVVEQLAVADLATDGIDAQLDDIVLQGDGFTGLCGLAGFVARHGGTGVIAAIGRCGGNAGIGAGSLVAVALLGLGLLLGVSGRFLANRVGWPCCSCQLFHNMTRQMERMTQRTVLWDCCIVGGYVGERRC